MLVGIEYFEQKQLQSSTKKRTRVGSRRVIYKKKKKTHWKYKRMTHWQGMIWNGMEDDFFIFHAGNFLPAYFHSILKIFHSILKFSSTFHSIFPYQGKCRTEAVRNLYCTFAALSVPLQVVAREGKQYGTMHLIFEALSQ